ncbi:MAG: hypothetical protein CL607_28770 [Anaerolineaceae bacterium]|jgi:hypothetical protein|nr:hypothetical protein [Anaerolineaceae bacterium]|tara:strand:- start:482 stop:844 length:363 start_codon:yes stop_codon:yes gene_type:complete
MSNLKRRLDTIEASKHLQALRWVEQNPELFAQFIGFVAALEQLDINPLEAMTKLIERANNLQDAHAKGQTIDPASITGYRPIFTQEQRRQRIIDLLYTAKQRRDGLTLDTVLDELSGAGQ